MDFEPWTPEWRAEELDAQMNTWSDCRACLLCAERHNVVFGMGNPCASILFVGEAPGEEEDKSGMPFHPQGRSGELFNALLEYAGIDRDLEFVTNLVGCRPPGNRNPTQQEKKSCWHRVLNIIYTIDPLIIVPVGVEALKTFAGRAVSIKDSHGEIFSSPHPSVRLPNDPQAGAEVVGHLFPKKGSDKREYTLDYDMIPIVHPSFILREDGVEDDKPINFSPSSWATKTLEDLKKIRYYAEILKARYAKPNCAI
jgi:uracil-DNA glycosylase family 4